MRNLHGLRALAVAALLAGCGAGGGAKADAGPGDAGPMADGGPGDAAVEAGPPGRRSFDVTAGLTSDGGALLPPTNSFTLVLEAAESRIIVGALGWSSVVPVTTTDGKTYKTTKPFSVGGGGQSACAGVTSVEYTSLEVTVTEVGLQGKGSGKAHVSCGDCLITVPFSAVLSGGADVTAPFLVVLGPGRVDPFTPFSVATSEPLPATAKARLVGSDGTQVELEPHIEPGVVPLVTRFEKPNVVLSFGVGHVVQLDGLVDFAGRAGLVDAGLRIASSLTPPLVAEDGFESVTGAAFGSAAVVTDPALVVAGSKSLYFGGNSAPPLGTVGPGAGLLVRLAVQPGDTMVRLSARGVSLSEETGFAGQVNIGSVGREAPPSGGFTMFEPAANIGRPGEAAIFLSPPKTFQFPLPKHVSGEVVVSITPTNFECGPAFMVNGMLVDDLRAE
jgi:hypothetical protein